MLSKSRPANPTQGGTAASQTLAEILMKDLRFPLQNLDIAKAYLFGSSLKGNGKDFDILFISYDFEGVSRIKRAEKVKLNFLSKNIDPVCMSEKEFDRLTKQNSLFLSEILKSAILIYERQSS